jgi:hypothetical protein
MAESSDLVAKLQEADPEVQGYVAALKAENAKLHKKIAKLEAENVSLEHRVNALEQERKQHAIQLNIGIQRDLGDNLRDAQSRTKPEPDPA